jgi:hypothetical protein
MEHTAPERAINGDVLRRRMADIEMSFPGRLEAPNPE